MNSSPSTAGRLADLSRECLALMLIAGSSGAASFALNIGPAVSGSVPDLFRAAFGVLGLAAAVTMWRQPLIGRLLGLFWAGIQIPVYAWSTAGSPTLQALAFPITATSQTTINGQTSSYSQMGINLIGLILTIWIYARRDLFETRR